MRTINQTFFASLFLSQLADQILLFLVPLVVYRMTGSVAWSGAAFFLETLPRFLSFPVCGILCDRLSPLRLMHASQALRAAVALCGIAGHAATGGVGWLIAISALCGVLTTQGRMAREVILPQVFRNMRYETVTSYAQLADQLATVLGPLAGAALLDLWPWEGVVAFTAALFLAADAVAFLWERIARPALAEPERHRTNWFGPLVVAARHVWHLPGLREVVVLAAGLNCMIGVTSATSAAMVAGVFGGSDQDYALLQAGGALATVAVLLFCAHTKLGIATLGAVSFAAIVFGGLLTGLGAGPAVYVTGFLIIAGFDKMFSVYIRSMRQRIIPLRDFGKTTGLVVMLNNLSQPLAGLLVATFSPQVGLEPVILAITLAAALAGAAAFALMARR